MKTNKRVPEILRRFYDTYGWKKDETSGRYLGELLHEDLDEITQRYMNDNEMRYEAYFRNGGHFFLDAGCGAEPRRQMSKNFQKHICVDISPLGLKEARKQLGDQGLYVIADLANLPFKDESFDGTLASHCLYHIDKELQSNVLRELYRVTKVNKNILVFYASNYNLVSIFHLVFRAVLKTIKRRDKKHYSPNTKCPPPPVLLHS